MKKRTVRHAAVLLSVLLALSLAGCAKQNAKLTKWDCSVPCPELNSPDISYSDEKVVSKTGILTFQNRSDFDIVVHVSCGGDEETSGPVPAGGTYSLSCSKEKAYTIGAHGNAEAGTEIILFVYDGMETESYTK